MNEQHKSNTVKVKPNIDNNMTKALVFILVMGILLGLFTSLNFLLIYLIGYEAIYTGILILLLNMYLILKCYDKYFKVNITFKNTLFIGVPILFILTIINFLIIDYDFQGTVTYSYYRNGYLFHVIEESSKQFIPVSLIFIIIFAPIYRYLKKKKTGANR
ncbi:hypothetical protein GCM10022397_34260 [Flavivirga jejuensis]